MTPDCPDSYGVLCVFFDTWKNAGWAGVDLFFVLSGYLVSGLLFQEDRLHGSISIGRFYLRRGLKIWPPFIVLIVVYGGFELRFGRPFQLSQLLSEFFYTQNYIGGIWNHTWSLAVEEHFYLIIGITLYALSRSGRISDIKFFAFAVLATCLINRILLYNLGLPTTYLTHTRLDSLMFGVLLAHWCMIKTDWPKLVVRHQWTILLVSFASLSPLLWLDVSGAYFSTIGYSVNYIAFGAIILVATCHDKTLSRHAFFRFLSRLGTDSYSIYLWHMLAKRIISYYRKSGHPIPYLVEFAAFTVLSVVIGVVMARAIERPMLNLRERFFPALSNQRANPYQQKTITDAAT